MILQPDHKHEQASPQIIIPPSTLNIQKQQQFPEPPLIFTQMLNNSNQLLNDTNSNEIKEQLKYREKKVLLSFAEGANQYLQHLRGKRNNDSHKLIKQMIQLQSDIVINRIQWGSLMVRDRNETSKFKKMKSQLKDKLSQMKSNILSLSSMDRRVSAQYDNAMEFKKRGYWMKPSQKSIQVKDFLDRMRKVQSQHKKKYEQSLAKHSEIIQSELNRQQQQKQQQKKQRFAKELEKQALWRKDRIRYFQQQEKKKQQIDDLLQKVSPEKPIYIQKEEEFIKNIIEPLEQERQQKLNQIKLIHHPFDQEEMDEHLQRYQQYRDSLVQEHRKKNDQENQANTQLEQELKDLYHGKFHSQIQPRFYNSVKLQKQNHRKKIIDYGASVLQHFKPPVDPRKKALVNERILDLQLLQNKKGRKVLLQDGSVVIQDRPEYDARKIGIQYLQKLREDNEGKPRKDRTSSMMEISEGSKIKRIDYLRQNKPNLNLKSTISGWKKVLDDKSYSSRDKYESIMEQANVMEQKAKQKQQQMRSYKRGDKSIELKGQMDKYYIESVAAKMMVLKDVILKQ